MALLLIILGLVLLLLTAWNTVGILLLIVGLILLFVPVVPYGPTTWRRR